VDLRVSDQGGGSKERFRERLFPARDSEGAGHREYDGPGRGSGAAGGAGANVRGAAGVRNGSVQVQFQGLERGVGPAGYGSAQFMKSLDLDNPVVEECVLA
jgi:hypothetical protein